MAPPGAPVGGIFEERDRPGSIPVVGGRRPGRVYGVGQAVLPGSILAAGRDRAHPWGMETLSFADDRIRCLPGAFRAEECAGFVHLAEAVGFAPAPVTTSVGFVMVPELRNNTRVIVDDVACAAALWERLREGIPARIGRFRAVGLNERLRFYRYDPGQFFAWHRDGAFHRPDGDQSLLTLMIYLNDGFEGGSTDFDVDGGRGPLSVVPERGMALLFHHPLRHQGAPVLRGVKLVLRTDVMFRRDAA